MNYVIKPLSQKSLFTAKFQQVQTHYNERYIINKTTERRHLAHNHETDLILLYDEKGKILNLILVYHDRGRRYILYAEL